MGVKSYPSTIFLAHIERRFVPLKRISGFHSAPLLLSTTHDLLAAIVAHEDAAMERESEMTETQQLREEQDAAYLRSLEADRKKEKERVEAERVQREEEEQLQLEEERLNRKQQERNALLKRMKQSLPEECSGGECIKLSLQLFDGQRVIRTFNPSDPLSTLYDWAFTLVGHDFEISLSDISIRTMLPPVHFENSKIPLSESEIRSQMKLIVELRNIN
jgi:FAS-associated factor 2